MQTTVTVDGMTCDHCERAVGGAIQEIDGVTAVEADAATGTVVVDHDGPLDHAAVEQQVSEAGYTLQP